MVDVRSPDLRSVRAADVRVVDDALCVLVNALDPDAVPLFDSPDVWAAFDAIERRAASAKVLLARRVEESCTWQRAGFRSAAEQLAGLSGSSVSSTRTMLETSRQVEELPATAAALRSGSLSRAKAEVIVSAAAVAPGAEASLLEAAARAPFSQVHKTCLEARAGVDAEGGTEPDNRSRAMRTRSTRSIELAREAAGDGARTPAKRTARNAGVIRVDHAALVRGAVEGGEVCEIAGLGPIPVTIARELLGDAVLELVITKGVDVVNVTHLGRRATAAQQAALRWLSPKCTREGCTRTQRLENDHRTRWTRHARDAPREPRSPLRTRPRPQDLPRLGPRRRSRKAAPWSHPTTPATPGTDDHPTNTEGARLRT